MGEVVPRVSDERLAYYGKSARFDGLHASVLCEELRAMIAEIRDARRDLAAAREEITSWKLKLATDSPQHAMEDRVKLLEQVKQLRLALNEAAYAWPRPNKYDVLIDATRPAPEEPAP